MPFRIKTVFSNTKRKKNKRRKSDAWVGRGGARQTYTKVQTDQLIDDIVACDFDGSPHAPTLRKIYLRAARILENGFDTTNPLVANAPFAALYAAAVIYEYHIVLKHHYDRVAATALGQPEPDEPDHRINYPKENVLMAHQAFHLVKCYVYGQPTTAEITSRDIHDNIITAPMVALYKRVRDSARKYIDNEVAYVISTEYFGNPITAPGTASQEYIEFLEFYDFRTLARAKIMEAWDVRNNITNPIGVHVPTTAVSTAGAWGAPIGSHIDQITTWIASNFTLNAILALISERTHPDPPPTTGGLTLNLNIEIDGAKDAFGRADARDGAADPAVPGTMVINKPGTPVHHVGGRSRRRRRRTRRKLRRR